MDTRVDQAELDKFTEKGRFEQGIVGRAVKAKQSAPNRMGMD